MTKREVERYRDTLLKLGRRTGRREEGLEGEALKPTGATGSGAPERAPGDAGDLSVDQFSHEVSLALLDNERVLLEQITAALRRIDAGAFGHCTECGRQIARERLEVLPYTPHCVDCARRVQGEVGGVVPPS
jgi:RNA polymerase-binding protein DksA